jgi:uncharacterized protein (TIGR00251 family)
MFGWRPTGPNGAELAGAGPTAPDRWKRVRSTQMPALVVEQRAEGVRIRVRVKPRASKSRILGVREGMLEIALAAPPVDGEANSELIRALAAALGRGKSTIEIVSGAASRSKLVAIAGLTEAELLSKLGQ